MISSTPILLYLHAAATLTMTGVIWFVQRVHYPLFRYADEADFARFAAAHQSRTTQIVAPLMLLEAASALLLFTEGTRISEPLALTGAALLLLIWLSTAFLQIPIHRRLLEGRDLGAIDRLVGTNWIRTLAWTARSLIALLLLGS